MKQLIPLFLIVLLTNCGQQEELHMKGSYTMISQTLKEGTTDTAINRKQLKLFTDDHVMYAAVRFPDSLASYGIGSYEIKDGKVLEHFFYTSANGPQKDTFELNINKTPKGYVQVFEEAFPDGRHYNQTEEYETVGKADSTPLDGAWKLINNYYVTKKGDSSSNPNLTEYKTYQSGYFIAAASYPDSSKKILTYMGYGNFQMDGPNRSKEVNTLSTYPPNIDTTFNIELEFLGKDSYKQTIIQRDSSKAIEIYERLKKN